MHGPSLSPGEIVAHLRRAIDHLESLGIAHDQAVSAVAGEYGVLRERVVFLVGKPALANGKEN